MKSFMKISTLVLALCSLFSFTSNDHNVRSVKATKGSGDEKWGLVGSFYDPAIGKRTNWAEDEYDDIPFKYNGAESRYELAFAFETGDEFKIRTNNSYTTEIGYGGNKAGNISTYLSNNGSNFKVEVAGTYLLKVADDDVANYGDKSYGFSIEKITTATFDAGRITFERLDSTESTEVQCNMISKLTITNKIESRKDGWNYVYKVVDDDVNTSIDNYLRAYIYSTESADSYDCVIYANVDIIYANSNSSYMFDQFGQLMDITFECFDTSNVTNMCHMFSGCSGFLSLDLSSFNTANVIDMSWMFSSCYNLKTIKFSSSFDTSSVTTMECMFTYCYALTEIDLSNFNTENVVTMERMFEDCHALTKLCAPSEENKLTFNTSKVTNMASMFSKCSGLTNLDVTAFNTENVTTLYEMFLGCSSITSIDVSNFNTKNVVDMSLMFMNMSELTTIIGQPITNDSDYNVLKFDTSNVKNLNYMFNGCSKLAKIDVSSFKTPSLTSMEGMFMDCSSLKDVDLSNFNTSKVTCMLGLFYQCESLESVDISSFDTSSVELSLEGYFEEPCQGTTMMFYGANKLKEIKTPAVMKENLVMDLPNLYTQVDGGVKQIDSTTVNMTLVPGSLELNKLLNDMYYLNTCENYDQASTLRERYNALSEADKEIFKTATDKDNVLMSDKLDYMEYMLTLNSEAEKNNIHIMTTINDSTSFLVVTTIISSLAILGYYMIQKRKSSID